MKWTSLSLKELPLHLTCRAELLDCAEERAASEMSMTSSLFEDSRPS